MDIKRTRQLGLAAGTALVAALLLPASASAHGIVGRSDLPIPRWLFAWAAAIVLVISFVALATLWPRPRLEQLEEREIARYPRCLEPAAGVIGVALYGLVIYAGFAGTQMPTANLDPTFIYVIFWVGLAFASVLVGDVFRAFNPWRAIARAFVFVARLARGGTELKPIAEYPSWLGRWPAALGVLGFAWLELVYVNKDVPQTLAILSLAYAAVQLVGMGLYGIETWTERGDAFSVYFGLFARLSPLHWARGRIYLRPPFVGAIGLDLMPGTVALLAVMIGSTSFDGFSVGSAWASLEPHVQSAFSNLGASTTTAIELAFTVGLLGLIVVIGSFYRLGVLGMRSLGGYSATELSRRFVHTLLPISLAYVIAHYFSLLAYQGQAIAYLASDPLGNGSNIFGTASNQINYSFVTANAIWYVQVGALVVGHAAGLTLAHDRALLMYRRMQDAVRSQYWMLTVMVGFTSLGLWILSSTH
jgi:hypothetical protein